MRGETTAQHSKQLIAMIAKVLAAADDGDQPVVRAHLHSVLKTATALRVVPETNNG